jgi:hypothetical protein
MDLTPSRFAVARKALELKALELRLCVRRRVPAKRSSRVG